MVNGILINVSFAGDLNYIFSNTGNNIFSCGISIVPNLVKISATAFPENISAMYQQISISPSIKYIYSFNSNRDKNIGLAFKVYYQYSILNYDLMELNNKICSTYNNENLKNYCSLIGFEISLPIILF